MKIIPTLLLLIFLSIPIYSQNKNGIYDEQGRQIIPRGFVIITEDQVGDIYYTPEDYHRMVRMGANFQVIRLKLGKLGGYPGNDLQETYLLHLDSLIQMAKNAGIMTDFKMTVYGTKDFSWGDFWRNKEDQFNYLVNAWKLLAERYKDESYVFGYDLLNEPLKGDVDVSYTKMESDFLIPLILKIMDEIQQISPDKKLMYQPILVNDPDRKIYNPPFIDMKTPVKRKNIMYAPHIYEGNISKINDWIHKYQRDAAISGTPIFIGEWGPATYRSTDSSILNQHNFIEFYIATANIFDSLQFGTVKAWFTGTRFTGNSAQGPFTWSIFKDNQGVGTTERKYIVDIIARPYPQCIAGKINEFQFDFPTRTLHLNVIPDNSKGASKIFVPADRWYPDGFTVIAGETILSHNPLKNIGLEVFHSGNGDPSDFVWDPYNQQLIVLRWPEDGKDVHLRIEPGFLK